MTLLHYVFRAATSLEENYEIRLGYLSSDLQSQEKRVALYPLWLIGTLFQIHLHQMAPMCALEGTTNRNSENPDEYENGGSVNGAERVGRLGEEGSQCLHNSERLVVRS